MLQHSLLRDSRFVMARMLQTHSFLPVRSRATLKASQGIYKIRKAR